MNHTMILNTMTNVKVLSFGEDLGEVLGNAVYTVRVILNIDPDVVEVKSAFMPKLPKQEVICNAVRVFPNPAKETISVAFDQPISNDGVIEVWSIVGKKLLYNTIFKDFVEQKVNVSSLSSGIYFYIIKLNGDKFSSGKLIILNK